MQTHKIDLCPASCQTSLSAVLLLAGSRYQERCLIGCRPQALWHWPRMVLAPQQGPSFVQQPFSTHEWCSQQRSAKLSLLDVTISVLAFLFKPSQGLFLGSIHDHLGRNPITLEDNGERVVGITLLFHQVRLQPMETSGVHLCVQIAPTRFRLCLHHVSEHIMTKVPVEKLPVVCSEAV